MTLVICDKTFVSTSGWRDFEDFMLSCEFFLILLREAGTDLSAFEWEIVDRLFGCASMVHCVVFNKFLALGR